MATPDVLLDPCRRKSKRSPVTVGEGEIVCVTVKPVGGPAELCCGLLRFDEVVLRVCALPLKLLDASAKLSVDDVGGEPSENWKGSAFEEAIAAHFESAGYSVVDLETRNRRLMELGFYPGEPVSPGDRDWFGEGPCRSAFDRRLLQKHREPDRRRSARRRSRTRRDDRDR